MRNWNKQKESVPEIKILDEEPLIIEEESKRGNLFEDNWNSKNLETSNFLPVSDDKLDNNGLLMPEQFVKKSEKKPTKPQIVDNLRVS